MVRYSYLFRNFPQLVVSHTVKGFSMVNEAEVDAFLELSCLFCDSLDIGNLIFGSSTFSKSSLNIRKSSVHVLLKPSLENFEHFFDGMWDECNCAVAWTLFGIAFLWFWSENWPFSVLWPLLSFPNLLYWVKHFNNIIFFFFKIWNSSTGIPSTPLALFIMMLPKPTWLSTPGCLAPGEWSHHRG